jgi:hypothetical protein
MSRAARLVVGKLVVFLAGCWVLFLAAGIAAALRGSVGLLQFPLFLIPGCAFGPAVYYALLLHRADASERSWKYMVVYAVAGVVLMIGSGDALHRMGA